MVEVLIVFSVFTIGVAMGMYSLRSKVHNILVLLRDRMQYQRTLHAQPEEQEHITTILITADYIDSKLVGRMFEWEIWSNTESVLHSTTWMFPPNTRGYDREVPYAEWHS